MRTASTDPPAESTSLVGHIVGSYRILARLGAGGMGTVWLAEHTLLGRQVAIKFLHADISRNAATVERFFAEARAATRITDPGIVVIYDFGWHTDGSAYIVMEYLAGESLAARLHAAQRLPLAHALHIIEQAAMAMAVAHAAGIVHRDLKPDNIFLTPDPVAPGGERVKLLDFGIAKLIGDDDPARPRTRTGLIMGTPMYMSPEQCRGEATVDHRTDIYALGCVLFHVLCGREPFVAVTAADLIAAHLREAPVPPSTFDPHLPPAIDRIVLRCLAKDANDRYASMTELVRDLRASVGFAGAVPTIAPRRASPTPRPVLSTLGTSAGESLAAPPKRRRRFALAIVVISALAGIVGIASTRRSSSVEPARPAIVPDDAPPPPPPPTVEIEPVIEPAPAPPPPPAKRRHRPSPRPYDPLDTR